MGIVLAYHSDDDRQKIREYSFPPKEQQHCTGAEGNAQQEEQNLPPRDSTQQGPPAEYGHGGKKRHLQSDPNRRCTNYEQTKFAQASTLDFKAQQEQHQSNQCQNAWP